MNGPLPNRLNAISQRDGRGYSIIEVLLAAVVMSLMLVAALELLGHLGSARHSAMQSGAQDRYIIDTIQEIMLVDYEDQSDPDHFGPETGEVNRSQFDDIDDYHDWSGAPQTQSGDAYSDLAHTTSLISVRFVQANDLQTTAATDEGFKEVTIVVSESDGRVMQQRRFVLADVP